MSAQKKSVGEGLGVFLERNQKAIRRHDFEGGRGAVRVG